MQGEMTSETFPAAGLLTSALNYLKGMDLSPERFSYTAWFFGPTPEEWLLQLTARKGEPLVQIAAVASKENQPKMTIYDPPSGHRYGFPKQYLPLPGETLEDTLRRDHYPDKEIEQGMAKWVRFWEEPDESTPTS